MIKSTFITRQPMTLDEAIDKLNASGCRAGKHRDPKIRQALAIDPDENCLLLTDDMGDYATASINLRRNEMANNDEYHGPQSRVIGQQYGDDNVDRMVAILDMTSGLEDESGEMHIFVTVDED